MAEAMAYEKFEILNGKSLLFPVQADLPLQSPARLETLAKLVVDPSREARVACEEITRVPTVTVFDISFFGTEAFAAWK
jgi:hypothetical protein